MWSQIKRIHPSESDRRNLSRFRTETPKGDDRWDFKSVVVNKPWGYEYLMYENPEVAVWILHIKKNHATSLHCHPNKKTSLLVLDGDVTCQTLEGWVDLDALSGLVIEKGVFHSTRANSKGGAFVMEVETPPVKRDLVRLKDEYGRAQKPYEGAKKMSKDTGKYEYVSFTKNQKRTSVKKLKDCTFSLCTSNELRAMSPAKRAIICLLKGRAFADDRSTQLEIGEIVPYDELASLHKDAMTHDSLVLLVQYSKNN